MDNPHRTCNSCNCDYGDVTSKMQLLAPLLTGLITLVYFLARAVDDDFITVDFEKEPVE